MTNETLVNKLADQLLTQCGDDLGVAITALQAVARNQYVPVVPTGLTPLTTDGVKAALTTSSYFADFVSAKFWERKDNNDVYRITYYNDDNNADLQLEHGFVFVDLSTGKAEW